MSRPVLPILLVLGLASTGVWGQQADPPNPEEKGTYLGVLFSAVPEVLYAQLPELPRNQGVWVTHILPKSPAEAAELQQHDILLQYDGKDIRDPEHFAKLIRADKPERKIKLLLFRAGRPMTAEVTLVLGPVLQIAEANKPAALIASEVPRGTAKQTGPPLVSVSATPLGGGQVKLTIEYYQDGTGRLQTVTCSGGPTEIDRELKKLPARVQDYTRVALSRIRALDLQKDARSSPSAAPKPR